MFEIRELRHLLSLDEFRHFGRAAKAVGLSQPALTKSLKRMELVLGARLFERSRAGVSPTAVGQEVLVRARRLVNEAEELKRTVDAMNGGEVGTVVVGVGPAMSETYVAAAIAAVAQERPRAKIVVRVDHWEQLSAWLLAGELDFYVADVSKARIDARCHYTALPPQRFAWFCRAGHPLARRRKKSVSRVELLDYPIATPRMPAWAVAWFAAALGDQGAAGLPSPFPAVECESYAMVKEIVLSSDCVSAALQPTLMRELQDRSLATLPVDAPELTTQAGVIRLADRKPSPLAAELIARVETLAISAKTSVRT